jgi:hypothetical protein
MGGGGGAGVQALPGAAATWRVGGGGRHDALPGGGSAETVRADLEPAVLHGPGDGLARPRMIEGAWRPERLGLFVVLQKQKNKNKSGPALLRPF